MEDGLNHERFNPVRDDQGLNPSTDGKTYAEVMKANKNPRVKICVTGFDVSLPSADIGKAMYHHFKSCGQIWSIIIRKKPSGVFMGINGDGVEEKALQLNGSNLRGWTLSVKVISEAEFRAIREHTPKQLALIRELHYDKRFMFGIGIMGYQIMQSEDDLQKSLRDDFSSCGEITHVYTPRDSQGGPCAPNTNFLYFDGEEAVKKAVKLGESLGLIVHALPKMSENSPMIPPHCIQIANEIRKLEMERNFSLDELTN